MHIHYGLVTDGVQNDFAFLAALSIERFGKQLSDLLFQVLASNKKPCGHRSLLEPLQVNVLSRSASLVGLGVCL